MPANPRKAGNSPEMEISPRLIPAVVEDVFGGDVHLTEIHLVNETASVVTVTMSDKQSTPRAVTPVVSIPANGDLVWELSGRYCPGGLTWVASVANAVCGYVRGW